MLKLFYNRTNKGGKNKNEKKEKHNMGITLIALVITIIVLLILAGVSIATLTGENGILTQAQNAKNETEEAEAQEREVLENQNSLIENILNGTTQGQDTNMELSLEINTEINGYVLLDISVSNITKEIYENYKNYFNNLIFEDQERIYLDNYMKVMIPQFSVELNKKISTEEEFIAAINELGIVDREVHNIKDLMSYIIEKSNEENGTDYTYKEFMENSISEFLKSGARNIRYNNRK